MRAAIDSSLTLKPLVGGEWGLGVQTGWSQINHLPASSGQPALCYHATAKSTLWHNIYTSALFSKRASRRGRDEEFGLWERSGRGWVWFSSHLKVWAWVLAEKAEASSSAGELKSLRWNAVLRTATLPSAEHSSQHLQRSFPPLSFSLVSPLGAGSQPQKLWSWYLSAAALNYHPNFTPPRSQPGSLSTATVEAILEAQKHSVLALDYREMLLERKTHFPSLMSSVLNTVA